MHKYKDLTSYSNGVGLFDERKIDSMSEPIVSTGFDRFGNAKFNYKRDKTTYDVKEGDTLLSVANRFLVGLQQLRFYNNVDKHTLAIKAGQKLHIPSAPVIVPPDGE